MLMISPLNLNLNLNSSFLTVLSAIFLIFFSYLHLIGLPMNCSDEICYDYSAALICRNLDKINMSLSKLMNIIIYDHFSLDFHQHKNFAKAIQVWL